MFALLKPEKSKAAPQKQGARQGCSSLPCAVGSEFTVVLEVEWENQVCSLGNNSLNKCHPSPAFLWGGGACNGDGAWTCHHGEVRMSTHESVMLHDLDDMVKIGHQHERVSCLVCYIAHLAC